LKKFIAFISIILILCSCSNSTIIFKGESQNWSSTYTVKHVNSEFHQTILKIKYKGKNLKDISGIKYSYKGIGVGGSGELPDLSVDGVISALSGGNGAIPPKDSVIKLMIEWNNRKEELELIRVEQGLGKKKLKD